MRSRVKTLAVVVLSALSWTLPATARAQMQPAFAPAPTSVGAPGVETLDLAAQVDDVLRRGAELESRSQWADCLNYYEDALRKYPKDESIRQRLRTAKIHYGIARRYNDSSFRRTLDTLTEEEAIAHYDEVLIKLQSHYVAEPNWQDLVDQGTRALEVGLSDPVFQQVHLAETPAEWIEAFRRELRKQAGLTVVRGRSDAVSMVRAAGRLARRHLGMSPAAVALEYSYQTSISLDAYSTYLTANQLNELYSQIDGNFVGLGVELQSGMGGLLIVKVIPGSPAQRGGLKAGDRITAVDGRSTEGLSTDEAAGMLQGPESSTVNVSIQSGVEMPRQVALRREQIEVPSIDTVKIVDREQGVGYFRLTSFQKTTPRELDAALWALHRDGMRSLIMDLRGNPGGLLTTSVEVADRFIEEGQIVSTRGRSPDQNWTYSAHKPGTWRVPLIVLIDHDSASAAEIFAGAIRDHRRGYIVGETSYGKGSVQSIFSLGHANAGLRLTTAKFYSPNGLPFSDIGVSPHIAVPKGEAHLVARPVDGAVPAADMERDAVINEALQVARRYFRPAEATTAAAAANTGTK